MCVLRHRRISRYKRVKPGIGKESEPTNDLFGCVLIGSRKGRPTAWFVLGTMCYASNGNVTACYGDVTLRMAGKWLGVSIVTPVTLVHPQVYQKDEARMTKECPKVLAHGHQILNEEHGGWPGSRVLGGRSGSRVLRARDPARGTVRGRRWRLSGVAASFQGACARSRMREESRQIQVIRVRRVWNGWGCLGEPGGLGLKRPACGTALRGGVRRAHPHTAPGFGSMPP
jgi:hypothetical protein